MGKSRKTSSASRSSSRRSRAKKPTTKSSADERRQMIAEAAYYRAEHRGFAGGDLVVDWLAAEAELSERLTTTR